jgi:hypothetical protein
MKPIGNKMQKTAGTLDPECCIVFTVTSRKETIEVRDNSWYLRQKRTALELNLFQERQNRTK